MPKPPSMPPTEVVPDPINDRPKRRNWTETDKKRILEAASRCKRRGELGELLRKEGIYSSHLHTWRKQLELYGESGLVPKRTGRPRKRSESDVRIAQLEKQVQRLSAKLDLAEKVIELQAKAHEILGIALPSIEDGSSTSSNSATHPSQSL